MTALLALDSPCSSEKIENFVVSRVTHRGFGRFLVTRARSTDPASWQPDSPGGRARLFLGGPLTAGGRTARATAPARHRRAGAPLICRWWRRTRSPPRWLRRTLWPSPGG